MERSPSPLAGEAHPHGPPGSRGGGAGQAGTARPPGVLTAQPNPQQETWRAPQPETWRAPQPEMWGAPQPGLDVIPGDLPRG